MNKKLLARITGAAGAGLLVANSLVPAFAAFTINISGNGAGTKNDVDLDYTSATTVTQSNDVYINNDVDMDADTGDNDVEKNTGANIDVETGDVDQSADISNSAGVNQAEIDTCGCDLDLEIAVEKNGADSVNKVDFDHTSTKTLFQDNDVKVKNDVDQDADTGDNDVEKNTGGDAALTTGDVDQSVMVSTQAGSNAASLGSSSDGGNLTVAVSENGADTKTDLDIAVAVATTSTQSNDVYVDTDVDADADTGDNDIEKNTGGDIDVETGDIDQSADIYNSAGANALAVSDCCELDGSVVVEKNGADSKNMFDLAWDMVSAFWQGAEKSDQDLKNDVDFDGDTGDNDVEKNTGDDLTTGDVTQDTMIENEAGANVIGGDADVEVQVSLGLLMSLLEAMLG